MACCPAARGNREDRPKETRRRPLPISARCVRHETSCSRCHATPCTIDLRKVIDGCRHYPVCFEVVLVTFSSVRRLIEIHEVSLRGTAIAFQLELVVVGTTFQLSLVHVSPSSDDSITRNLDISVLLRPEVEDLASCIDRQSVPLLGTLYRKCIPSDCVCVSLFFRQRDEPKL